MGTNKGATAGRRTVRRGWDSNPRYPYEYNSLAGSPIRPLSHLSRWCMSRLVHARSGGCGEGGIRTPGAPWLNGFQDRLLRPLGHLSEAQHATRVPEYMCPHRACQFPIDIVGRVHGSPGALVAGSGRASAAGAAGDPVHRLRTIRAGCIGGVEVWGVATCVASRYSGCKVRHLHALRTRPRSVLDRLRRDLLITILLQKLRSFWWAGGRAGMRVRRAGAAACGRGGLVECRG